MDIIYKILFKYRKMKGLHIVIKLIGDINKDPSTKNHKEYLEKELRGWPIIFIDNSETIDIIYP